MVYNGIFQLSVTGMTPGMTPLPSQNASQSTVATDPAPVSLTLPKRRGRGRPPGTKAVVVRDVRALGVHHFAFVRASIYGLDLRDSFTRYLEWSEANSDLRHIEHLRGELRRQILEAGRLLDASLPADRKITNFIEVLKADTPAPKVVSRPSPQEWLAEQGIDEDFYSEAELMAEYSAAFGLDLPDEQDKSDPTKDLASAQVKALNHLETVLAIQPMPLDRVDRWFAKGVYIKLRSVGVLTLKDLFAYVNVYGFRWYSKIKGLGALRAKLIVGWLKSQQETLNLLISSAVDEPKALRSLRTRNVVGAAASEVAVPSQLHALAMAPSSQGTFRSHMANTFGAADDQQAIAAWLAGYREKPPTFRSYRKEVDRFMLWCSRELSKPISSVTSMDCLAYRKFLQAIPSHWINPTPVPRSDPSWMPFRKQPAPSSQKQSLVILQTMFSGLVAAGYLVANPMNSLMKGFDLPTSSIDISRSFTELEWQHVLRSLKGMAPGPARLRLECILELFVSSGVRLDELASASMSSLRKVTLPDLPDSWVLTVTGKRNKTREVPLSNFVVDLLHEHIRPFAHLDSKQNSESAIALIRALGQSVPQWQAGDDNTFTAEPINLTPGARLSAAGMYGVLKRFFTAASKTAGDYELEPLRFKKASTHWMRHTFVRNALVDGTPIEVVSELAGHASIDTTSIYSSQELARKVRAVQSMRRRQLQDEST